MITHLKDRFGEEELNSALRSMVSDMGWDCLRQILESDGRLLGHFRAGGFQLKLQNAERAKNVILKAAEEEDYERLFLFWCHDRDDLRSVLEAWSEDEVGTGETGAEQPVPEQPLSQENFEKLIEGLRNQEGLYFLCFSPIVFSEQQELNLLDSLGRENAVQSSSEETTRSHAQAENPRAELTGLKTELRQAQRENRKLLKEHGQLQERVQKIEADLKNAKAINRQFEEQIARLENAENERIVRLESKIESQMKQLKETEALLDGLRLELKQKETDAEKLKEEKDAIEKEFTKRIGDVLGQLNSSDIIRALNEPDEVKELLLSVVKIPVADESARSSARPAYIDDFWLKVLQAESDTVKTLGEITLESASEQDFSNNWADLSDRLVDLKYSLRARAVLINFFYEILSKFYDMDECIPEPAVAPQPASALAPSKRNVFAQRLDSLDLSTMTLNSLRRVSILNIGDLVKKQERDLLRLKNFGRKNLNEVKEALAEKGLRLGMKISNL
jgi:hypothetical protein